MHKKLLTLAVAGALAAPGIALAQSSVEVYGFVHMALGKWKFSESTAGIPSVSKWDVASSASNVGVRGRESLGGGLTAWFQVETNAPMERSNNIAHTSGFASRNSAVGLQGAFGNVFLGQWSTPYADLGGLWSVGTVGPWGPLTSIINRRETTGTNNNFNCSNTASGTGAAVGGNCDGVEGGAGVGHAFWRRVSNSVFYQSTVFSGVQLKMAWQPNQEKSTQTTGGSLAQDPSLWSTAVQWSGMGGRARAGVGWDRHKDYTTVGKTDTGWTVVGGFNFGVVDVGVAYERMTYKAANSDCKARQYAVAIAVPVGAGAIRGSYSIAKDIDGVYSNAAAPAGVTSLNANCGALPTAAAPVNDNGARQWNIGYEHRFSKRTTVGVGYAAIRNDAGAGGNAFTWSGAPTTQSGASLAVPLGSDISTYFVSMIHRF